MSYSQYHMLCKNPDKLQELHWTNQVPQAEAGGA
jgi:hypothetical protein